MIRIARERIGDLFALARSESRGGSGPLPHRYVHLARRIGMRFNLRLPQEYRSRYCRRCSAYWVEGRTVRTRLRRGCCVRTCLACGSQQRIGLHPRPPTVIPEEMNPGIEGKPQVPTLVEDTDEGEDSDEGEEE